MWHRLAAARLARGRGDLAAHRRRRQRDPGRQDDPSPRQSRFAAPV